jgi:hypothetical protein
LENDAPYVDHDEKNQKMLHISVGTREQHGVYNQKGIFLSSPELQIMVLRSCSAKHEKLQWVAIDWPSVLQPFQVI